MKKIVFILFPLLLLASEKDISNRINGLEKEINTLKQQMRYHQDDLDERMPIIENAEKKAIMDKLDLSPELEIRADSFRYTLGKIAGEDTRIYGNPAYQPYGTYQRRDEFSKNFDTAGFIKFRLNMNAKLDENVGFHGRLLFVNSTQADQRICILSRDIKSNSASSAFDVDRAYFDYSPNKNSDYAFTFSFGLLPTTGGTPMQYAQNTQRNSMFPALVFDMNTYGIIATQKLPGKTFIRAILAKAYTLNESFYPYQCNRENIDNATVMGAYIDTKVDFLGDALLSFGTNVLKDLKAHPYLGPDVTANNAHVLGDMVTFGLGVDINHISESKFTVFAHTAISHPHGNGQKDDYQIALNPNDASQTIADGKTASGDAGFSTADYAQGSMLSRNGYSVYTGVKYDFSKSLNFGAEYNYGNKYWFSATQGAEDMYNKLAIRGDVAEVYAMWKFHEHIYTKLGYMYTKENYTGSGWHFGEPASKDGKQQVSYLTINAKF